MPGKRLAILGTAVFLVLAPGFVAGLVPWWMTHWRPAPPLFGLASLRYSGALLIALGVGCLLDSFARFAWQGHGTPAPVLPTRQLVITGLYRHVRNPMYVAVLSIIVGQGLVWGSRMVLAYGGSVWLLFHLFVVVYEERTLQAAYGPAYSRYCAAVPRWIPRVVPWRGGTDPQTG